MSRLDILRTDTDPRRLVHEAQALAVSPDPNDQLDLRVALVNTDLLQRLDDAERYRGDRRELRVRRVLDRLSQNPAGRPTLAALCADRGFLAEPSRVDLLILACAELRPPPAETVRLWDVCSQPEDGYGFLTIEALCRNGTEPAVALLCRKLLDPVHPDDDKAIWMRTSILSHRTDPVLLTGLLQLLQGPMDPALKRDLVEAIVDWQPALWYPIHGRVDPPDWSTASRQAVALLDAIAQHALLHVPMDGTLTAAVRKLSSALPR